MKTFFVPCFAGLLAALVLATACQSPSTPAKSTPLSSAKALTAFSFAGLSPAVTGTVDETAHTVALTVPYFTSVTALVATFTTTGASVKVGSTTQASGTTANDFTAAVTYTVVAADASIQNYVVTVTKRAVLTTLAGSGNTGSANATGTAASFQFPQGAVSDGTNLYVADTANSLIRKIVISSGVVTTLAGTGSPGTSDGTGANASFKYPRGVATDGTNLYVTDTNANTIRKIVISSGQVSTLVPATSGLSAPVGIATDGTNLYVADNGKNRIVQIVISTGAVTTLAGSGTAGSSDGTGTSATFQSPWGVATDGTNLFVTDYTNHLIRQIVIKSGVVTTLAGSTTPGFVDATGTAASFHYPAGIATDGSKVYVNDQWNNAIRQIDLASKAVTTVITDADVLGTTCGLAMNSAYPGQLFVASNAASKIALIQ